MTDNVSGTTPIDSQISTANLNSFQSLAMVGASVIEDLQNDVQTITAFIEDPSNGGTIFDGEVTLDSETFDTQAAQTLLNSALQMLNTAVTQWSSIIQQEGQAGQTLTQVRS